MFHNGDLIGGNVGRVMISNCHLMGARRHGLCLTNLRPTGGAGGGGSINGENYIRVTKIGGCQGAGVVLWGAGDGAMSDMWVHDCGASNIYVRDSVDMKLSRLQLEGAGGWNIQADWCMGLHVSSSNMWGGRMGNIRADR